MRAVGLASQDLTYQPLIRLFSTHSRQPGVQTAVLASPLLERRETPVATGGDTKQVAMTCVKGQGTVKFSDPAQSYFQEYIQRKKKSQWKKIITSSMTLTASTISKKRKES